MTVLEAIKNQKKDKGIYGQMFNGKWGKEFEKQLMKYKDKEYSFTIMSKCYDIALKKTGSVFV